MLASWKTVFVESESKNLSESRKVGDVARERDSASEGERNGDFLIKKAITRAICGVE